MSEKLIATNPNAKKLYSLLEVVEAGIVLTGTEIKSIRNQTPNIKDAYVEVSSSQGTLEAWLYNSNIPPYSHGNIWNHEPTRKRKLLLHKHQIKHLYGSITKKGTTIVPTRMYFKNGIVKVELCLGKGKKLHDKRHEIRKKSAEREMQRALKKSKC